MVGELYPNYIPSPDTMVPLGLLNVAKVGKAEQWQLAVVPLAFRCCVFGEKDLVEGGYPIYIYSIHMHTIHVYYILYIYNCVYNCIYIRNYIVYTKVIYYMI